MSSGDFKKHIRALAGTDCRSSADNVTRGILEDMQTHMEELVSAGRLEKIWAVNFHGPAYRLFPAPKSKAELTVDVAQTASAYFVSRTVGAWGLLEDTVKAWENAK